MKKYAFAGAGGRATTMFAVPLAKEYGDVAQIVGVFDPNRKRCEALAKRTETEIPLYTDFDTMLEETKPDVVIVATVDRYHHEYIVRALHAGCDVISEKPLTIDDEKCRAILKAQEQTGKKVTVTFNVRFMQRREKCQEQHNGKSRPCVYAQYPRIGQRIPRDSLHNASGKCQTYPT